MKNYDSHRYCDILRYKDTLIRLITKYIPHGTIYLLNSRAVGLSHDASDIDVAVDAGAPIDASIIDQICTDIDELELSFFVDVMDVHSVHAALQQQIRDHGIVWKV